MSGNKEVNLVQSYIELNKFCQGSDYDRALKAAGKILQIAPNEQKAFHCKVICCIQLHNFKEALAVLTNPKNAALAANLHFEKAYAQYRLNCPTEALQTVDNAPEMTLALKELRAQILYRLEQYQDCYNLYRDIVKNTTDEYEDERKTNMAAVVANLGALNPQYRATLVEASSLVKDGKQSAAVNLLLAQGGTLTLAAAQVLLANRFASLRAVWQAAAGVHARAGDAAAAAAAHEAVARAAPQDKRSLARLGKIDIEALESSKWMMGAKVVKKTVQSKQEQSPGCLFQSCVNLELSSQSHEIRLGGRSGPLGVIAGLTQDAHIYSMSASPDYDPAARQDYRPATSSENVYEYVLEHKLADNMNVPSIRTPVLRAVPLSPTDGDPEPDSTNPESIIQSARNKVDKEVEYHITEKRHDTEMSVDTLSGLVRIEEGLDSIGRIAYPVIQETDDSGDGSYDNTSATLIQAPMNTAIVQNVTKLPQNFTINVDATVSNITAIQNVSQDVGNQTLWLPTILATSATTADPKNEDDRSQSGMSQIIITSESYVNDANQAGRRNIVTETSYISRPKSSKVQILSNISIPKNTNYSQQYITQSKDIVPPVYGTQNHVYKLSTNVMSQKHLNNSVLCSKPSKNQSLIGCSTLSPAVISSPIKNVSYSHTFTKSTNMKSLSKVNNGANLNTVVAASSGNTQCHILSRVVSGPNKMSVHSGRKSVNTLKQSKNCSQLSSQKNQSRAIKIIQQTGSTHKSDGKTWPVPGVASYKNQQPIYGVVDSNTSKIIQKVGSPTHKSHQQIQKLPSKGERLVLQSPCGPYASWPHYVQSGATPNLRYVQTYAPTDNQLSTVSQVSANQQLTAQILQSLSQPKLLLQSSANPALHGSVAAPTVDEPIEPKPELRRYSFHDLALVMLDHTYALPKQKQPAPAPPPPAPLPVTPTPPPPAVVSPTPVATPMSPLKRNSPVIMSTAAYEMPLTVPPGPSLPAQSLPMSSLAYKPLPVTTQDEDTASVISSLEGERRDPAVGGSDTETAPEGEEEGKTRCVCDFTHDDGYMICCDRCGEWQHVDCMGIDRGNIPDAYQCELCQPRAVDARHARAIQMRKREELSALGEDTDEDGRDAPRRRRLLTVTTYTDTSGSCVTTYNSATPTIPAIPALPPLPQPTLSLPKRGPKRPKKAEVVRKGNKRKLTEKRVKRKKEMMMNRSKYNSSVSSQSHWGDSFEQAVTNHYSPELRAKIMKYSSKLGNTPNMSSAITAHLCTTVPHAGGKILIATKDLKENTAVIEMRGKYMLSNQHRPQLQNSARAGSQKPGPFVFFYRLPKDNTQICIDTRTYGNEARFVRRSCKPTRSSNTVSLRIPSNTEITVGHDTNGSKQPCACGNPKHCKVNGLSPMLLRKSIDYLPREKRSRNRCSSSSSPLSPPLAPVLASPVKEYPCPVTPIKVEKRSPIKYEYPPMSPVKNTAIMALNFDLPIKAEDPEDIKPEMDLTTKEEMKPEIDEPDYVKKETDVDEVDNFPPEEPAAPEVKTEQESEPEPVKADTEPLAVVEELKPPKIEEATTDLENLVSDEEKPQIKKNEVPKVEEVKQEVIKEDLPKLELVRLETPKKEAPKVEEKERKLRTDDERPATREYTAKSACHDRSSRSTFERMEKAEQRKQEVKERQKRRESDPHPNAPDKDDDDDFHCSSKKRKKRKGRARTTSQSNRRRLNSADSDMDLGLSSACLLVEAAVGSVESAFKLPKTKKTMATEWIGRSPDRSPSPYRSPYRPPLMSASSLESLVRVASTMIGDLSGSQDFHEEERHVSPPRTPGRDRSRPPKKARRITRSTPPTEVVETTPTVMIPQHSAKKRWLRQAISEESDSPNAESPPNEIVTPLKKRRLARESLSYETNIIVPCNDETSPNLTSEDSPVKDDGGLIRQYNVRGIMESIYGRDRTRSDSGQGSDDQCHMEHDVLNVNMAQTHDTEHIRRIIGVPTPEHELPPAVHDSDFSSNNNNLELDDTNYNKVVPMDIDITITPQPKLETNDTPGCDIKALETQNSSRSADTSGNSSPQRDEMDDIQKKIHSFHTENILILKSRNKKPPKEKRKKVNLNFDLNMVDDQISIQLRTENEHMSPEINGDIHDDISNSALLAPENIPLPDDPGPIPPLETIPLPEEPMRPLKKQFTGNMRNSKSVVINGVVHDSYTITESMTLPAPENIPLPEDQGLTVIPPLETIPLPEEPRRPLKVRAKQHIEKPEEKESSNDADSKSSEVNGDIHSDMSNSGGEYGKIPHVESIPLPEDIPSLEAIPLPEEPMQSVSAASPPMASKPEDKPFVKEKPSVLETLPFSSRFSSAGLFSGIFSNFSQQLKMDSTADSVPSIIKSAIDRTTSLDNSIFDKDSITGVDDLKSVQEILTRVNNMDSNNSVLLSGVLQGSSGSGSPRAAPEHKPAKPFGARVNDPRLNPPPQDKPKPVRRKLSITEYRKRQKARLRPRKHLQLKAVRSPGPSGPRSRQRRRRVAVAPASHEIRLGGRSGPLGVIAGLTQDAHIYSMSASPDYDPAARQDYRPATSSENVYEYVLEHKLADNMNVPSIRTPVLRAVALSPTDGDPEPDSTNPESIIQSARNKVDKEVEYHITEKRHDTEMSVDTLSGLVRIEEGLDSIGRIAYPVIQETDDSGDGSYDNTSATLIQAPMNTAIVQNVTKLPQNFTINVDATVSNITAIQNVSQDVGNQTLWLPTILATSATTADPKNEDDRSQSANQQLTAQILQSLSQPKLLLQSSANPALHGSVAAPTVDEPIEPKPVNQRRIVL
ncbi:hypothetical protein MSG28_007421 [Choristoneura fumiferana]|uniref:Uncharacterized protein n=1 Tax=Choristoneura fumiferana TaxID=7141 RepID=A0ACC0JXB8_CHOFU|nr:hypothetical protein MSG28_007421 [Choristoneura fumiferana]